MDITQAIFDKLVGDSELVALLGTFGSGSPTEPCIFTGWPVPPDAPRPYVYTRGAVSISSFDLLADDFGQDITRDVTAIADNTGSDAAIETIAERIRTLLHRQPLTVPSGVHVMTQCIQGPVVAETDDSLTGRRLTFRIVVMEA